jgi:hypothetical protein
MHAHLIWHSRASKRACFTLTFHAVVLDLLSQTLTSHTNASSSNLHSFYTIAVAHAISAAPKRHPDFTTNTCENGINASFRPYHLHILGFDKSSTRRKGTNASFRPCHLHFFGFAQPCA